MKYKYGYKKISRSGSTSEGGYSLIRRLFGIAFLGERFTKIYKC